MPTSPPPFTREVDPVLAAIARGVRLLGTATPTNAAEERARLVGRARAGAFELPRWRYVRRDLGGLRRRLASLGPALAPYLDEPLAPAYAARIAELDLEASICEAVGTKGVSAMAAARFSPFARASAKKAATLARRLAAEPPVPEEDARPIPTDDEGDPRSLVRRIRHEIARAGLGFRVEVLADLASLASTGDGTIYVGGGRAASEDATRRTVVHEIEGHALPRTIARSLAPAFFSIGTARGTDEQEGLAIWKEARAVGLSARRKRELAARHLVVDWMRDGGTFADVAARLAGDLAFTGEDAIRLAERAFRGSDGVYAGLGRERCYLEAWIRVEAHLARAPADEAILSSGQVALAYVDALRPFS